MVRANRCLSKLFIFSKVPMLFILLLSPRKKLSNLVTLFSLVLCGGSFRDRLKIAQVLFYILPKFSHHPELWGLPLMISLIP